MEEQIKKLSQISDSVLKKVDYLKKEGRFTEKLLLNIAQELNEISSEVILSVQKQTSLGYACVIERVFVGMKEIMETALLLARKKDDSPKPLPQFNLQIPNFLSALQLGSVSVLDQIGISVPQVETHQLPWSEYKNSGLLANNRQSKIYAEKGTSTVLDYYQNCIKVIERKEERENEMHSLIQHTNDTIHLISEALQNRSKHEHNYQQQDAKELDKLVNDFNMNKLDLDSALKEVDWESLKQNAQNFDEMQSKIKQHIIEVQKQTAERVLKYFTNKQQELEKKKYILNDMKNKIKMKVLKPEDCRCAIYVNDIINLKSKIEQQQQEMVKQSTICREKDLQIKEFQIQYKILENKIIQYELDKKDTMSRQEFLYSQRVRPPFEKKSSDNLISINNEDEKMFMKSSNIDISSRGAGGAHLSVPLTSSQNISSDQNKFYKNKSIVIARAIKLVNVLDQPLQSRRLTQIQGILDGQTTQQLTLLSDLVKEIEENDLNESDRANLVLQESYDTKSCTNQQKTNNSQRNIDQERDRIKSRLNQSFTQLEDENQQNTPHNYENDTQNVTLRVPLKIERRSSVSISTKGGRSTSRQNFDGLNRKVQNLSPEGIALNRSKSSQIKPQLARSNSIKLRGQPQQSNHQKKLSQTSIPLELQQVLQNPYGQISDELRGKVESQNFTDRGQIQYNDSESLIQQQAEANSTKQVRISLSDKLKSVISESEISIQNQRSQSPLQEISKATPNFISQSVFNMDTNQNRHLQNGNNLNNANSVTSQRNYRWKQNVLEQIDDTSQKQKSHTLKSSCTTSPRDNNYQNNRIDFKSRQDLEQIHQKQINEELIYFNQNFQDIPDSQETNIIQQAQNKVPGYEMGNEINEQILISMYKNLEKNTEIKNLMNSIIPDKFSNQKKLEFQEFKKFISKMQAQHKRCGKDCIHLLRFYLRLGFVSTKYLTRKRLLRMSKPTIQPGFPCLPNS